MIIHLVQYGLVACMREMPPAKWPDGHRWSSDWKDVTCPHCLRGRDEPYTFHIDLNGPSITCKICGLTSFNKNDVIQHYCAHCRVFHDDLWPPARAQLIGHPEMVGAVAFSMITWPPAPQKPYA